MRLNRLDLTRYGKFTDYGIDFGDREAGCPDLHVVYGRNEAGKSTTLAAFLDLLFGIEKNSGYGFIHPYDTMRIGATLTLAGGVQHFARIKRQQNSLLDGHDQPVAPATILTELGGIDRESYRIMFSLDDEKLESGGESILASKGDLGELLFSASAGLADLSRSLGAVKAEADLFFKTSRTGALAEFKKRLDALRAERAAIDTRASDYGALLKARDQAAGLYDGTLASRGLIQVRMEEIRRHLGAIPRLVALRSVTEALVSFVDLPEPPPHWIRDLPGLQREETELAVRVAAVADEIDTLSAGRDALSLDEVALCHAAAVDGLALRRDRYTTAAIDLPERRQRLRDAETRIADLLRRIERSGEANPERLILGASIVGRLRELIEAQSGIEEAVRSSAAELAAARRRVEEAQVRLRTASAGTNARPGRPLAMVRLAAILVSLRSDDHAVRRGLADRSAEAGRLALVERLRELRPWEGDAATLAMLDVPDRETLDRWRGALAEAQRTHDRHAGVAEGLETDRRRFEAERDIIAATAGLVTDEDAAALRLARDQAWRDHRHSLDATSAERFEAALSQDDLALSRRFGQVADLAKLHQAEQALALAGAAGLRATELRDAAASAVRSLEVEVTGAIKDAAPALCGMTLPRFEGWLARRQKALEAADAVRTAERALADAVADGVSARETLLTALDSAGMIADPEADVETLLAVAHAAVDGERTLEALRVAVEERAHDVEARERLAEEAEAASRRWVAAWAEVCSTCWLADHGAIPTLATVRELMPALVDLASAIKDKGGLADRIAKMEGDQAAFSRAVDVLARTLGMADPDVPTLEAGIAERVRQARARAERRAVEETKLRDAWDRRRTLAAALDIHRHRASEMTGAFGVETLSEVAARLLDVARRDELRRRADEAEREVLENLRVASLVEAERVLAEADRDALGVELAELECRFQDLDQRCRDLFLAKARAADAVEAVGGDDKVADIEERRRTTLLEIEEGALRYLKLRAGALAAEHALRAYRDRHRSSMLARASEAFSTMSRGAYSGLAAQPDKEGDTLIALVSGGGSKKADELSKGTRFQLYLALRVAGYYEFASNRPPVPFIADDIMETFDDFRAEEAFRLFAGMAEKGQVIYLTHHRHLCDIARSVCPGTRIHEIAVE